MNMLFANQILRGWECGFIYDGSHVSGQLDKKDFTYRAVVQYPYPYYKYLVEERP